MGYKVTVRKNGKHAGEMHYPSEALAVGVASRMRKNGDVDLTVEKCGAACAPCGGKKANPAPRRRTVPMADIKAAVLAGADGGYLTDVARAPALRGVNFARIMAAAESLAKAGHVTYDGVTIAKKNPRRRNGTTAGEMAASRSMAYGHRNTEKIEAFVPAFLSLPRHGGNVILSQHPKSRIPSVVAIGSKPTKLQREMYAGCKLSVVPASKIKARPVGMNNPRRRRNPSMTAEQASTLVKQLGGMGKLKAMIGAKDFLRTERNGHPALAFKFKGSKRANYVAISLDPSDTYTLSFGKIVKYDLKPTGEIGGVYADQLKSVFERFTGLYLSL